MDGSGHSAEDADRRESSRVMTLSDIDHVVYPAPPSSTGYKNYKVPFTMYSPSSSVMRKFIVDFLQKFSKHLRIFSHGFDHGFDPV